MLLSLDPLKQRGLLIEHTRLYDRAHVLLISQRIQLRLERGRRVVRGHHCCVAAWTGVS